MDAKAHADHAHTHAHVDGDDLPDHGPHVVEPRSPAWLPVVGLLLAACALVWWLSTPSAAEEAAAAAAASASAAAASASASGAPVPEGDHPGEHGDPQPTPKPLVPPPPPGLAGKIPPGAFTVAPAASLKLQKK